MRMSTLLEEVRNFSLDEGFSPKEIKMAIGVASDKRYARGNMTGAVTAIEKIKKGLSNHPQVMAVLKRQNEDIDEAVSPAQQAAIAISKKERGEKPKKEEVQEDGHTDVASAQNNVKVAMSALTKMSGELAKLNPEDALPSWWTNKVAVAVDKLDGMADYLDTQVEALDTEDEPKVKEIIKKLKGASKAHAGQADDLEKAVKEEVELDEKENSYTVVHVKKGKEVVKAKSSYEAAKKFAKMKGLKNTSGVDAHLMEEVELDEAKYDLYHKDFSSAMQHAYAMAKKLHGVTIDPKEIDDKVATGPKKPSKGKTNSYRLKGKGGAIQVQVANLDDKKFELNMYKEEVELDEMKEPFVVVDTADGNKVVGTASDEKGAKSIITTSQLPPMRIKDKKTLKIVKVKKKQMIGQPIKEEVELDEMKSKSYALVIKGKVVAKGSKADMMKLKKQKGGELYLSPGTKIGDMVEEVQLPLYVVLDEMKMNDPKLLKMFDKLKKGDKIKLKTSSTINKGKDFVEYIVKSKNTVNKGRVEKITLATVGNEGAVKKFLYKRDGTVGFAIGDMGASIDDIKEGTWHIPDSPKLKSGLKKLMSKPIKLGKEGDDATNKIGEFIGDDELYDDLYVAGKKNPNGDARDVIKKAMKRLNIKEEINWLVEASAAQAAKDARRAMRSDPDMRSKRDSEDVSATTADVEKAANHIIMQLRKSVSMRGQKDVEFASGKQKVPLQIAQKVLDMYNKQRTSVDKSKFQMKIAKSYKDLLTTVKGR